MVATPSEIPGLEGMSDYRKEARQQPPAQPVHQQQSVQVPKVRLTKAELKRIQWDKERGEYEKNQNLGLPWNQNGAPQYDQTNTQQPHVPKAHMTMAEKKKLQWQQERGETAGVNGMGVNGVSNTTTTTAAAQYQPSTTHQLLPESSAAPYVGAPRSLTKAEIARQRWEAQKGEYETSGTGLATSDTDQVLTNTTPLHGTSPSTDSLYTSKAQQQRLLKWEKERKDSEQNSDLGLLIHNDKSIKNIEQIIPGKHLSKAERKRLEWERERDESAMDVQSGLTWKRPQTPQARRGKKDPRAESRQDQATPMMPQTSPGPVPKVHLTKAAMRRLEEQESGGRETQTGLIWARELTEESFKGKGKGTPRQGPYPMSPEIFTNPNPTSNMSLAEKKRLKWEQEMREKEEIDKAWQDYQTKQSLEMNMKKHTSHGDVSRAGDKYKTPSSQMFKSPLPSSQMTQFVMPLPEHYEAEPDPTYYHTPDRYTVVGNKVPDPPPVKLETEIPTTYETISRSGRVRTMHFPASAPVKPQAETLPTYEIISKSGTVRTEQVPGNVMHVPIRVEGDVVDGSGQSRALSRGVQSKAELKKQQWEKEKGECGLIFMGQHARQPHRFLT